MEIEVYRRGGVWPLQPRTIWSPDDPDQHGLVELLQKHDQGDFLRSVGEAVLQMIMEADVEGVIGAGARARREPDNVAQWILRARSRHAPGHAEPEGPPSYGTGLTFRGYLEARKMSEQALVAVIQKAWIGGVSTWRVDDLVQAMGLSGIPKSTVSTLCKDIDERVGEFLNRPLTAKGRMAGWMPPT